jgi:hypothetical protein
MGTDTQIGKGSLFQTVSKEGYSIMISTYKSLAKDVISNGFLLKTVSKRFLSKYSFIIFGIFFCQ